MSIGGDMKFEIYSTGQKIKELSFFEFIDFYYDEFGSECGNPSAVAQNIPLDQGTYIEKGYAVWKSNLSEAEQYYTKQESQCLHSKKYLNKITNSLQFYVCPDCKKEV